METMETMETTEQTINDYISQELVSDPAVLPLSSDTPLMDSHILDSTAFLSLIMFVEEHFGITVADSDLTRQNFETLAAVCAYVHARLSEKDRGAAQHE